MEHQQEVDQTKADRQKQLKAMWGEMTLEQLGKEIQYYSNLLENTPNGDPMRNRTERELASLNLYKKEFFPEPEVVEEEASESSSGLEEEEESEDNENWDCEYCGQLNESNDDSQCMFCGQERFEDEE